MAGGDESVRTGDKKENGIWCQGCRYIHGPLYVCEHYPEDLRIRIKKQGDEWRRNLLDPVWVAARMAEGLPREAIEISRALAGISMDEVKG